MEILFNIITTIFIPLIIASMTGRYILFYSKKTEYISKLLGMFCSHNRTFCMKEAKKIFRSNYGTDDILRISGEFNTFLMSLSETPEKISGLSGVPSFMLKNKKIFSYHQDYKGKKDNLPLYYNNEGFFCSKCKQEKCKNRGKGGILFDDYYRDKHLNDETTLYSFLPVELVPEIQKTIEYCNKNINPKLLWVIFGNKKQITISDIFDKLKQLIYKERKTT